MEETKELLKSFGFEIADVEVTESERLDPKATAKEINDKFDTEFKLKNAARVVINGTVKVSFLGESSEEDAEFEFTCGKIGSKWYILDLEDTTEEVFEEEAEEMEEDTEEVTEEDTEEDTEEEDTEEASEDDGDDDYDEDINSISEILDKDTAESYVADVPSGVSDDLEDYTFSFEGKVLTLPFALSELDSSWELDMDYFYNKDEEIEAGDSASSYQFENSKYDEWFYMYLTVCNPTDDTIAYEDGSARTIDASIEYCDTDNYPELIIAKGITWGSSLHDVYDAYGDADSIYEGYNGEYVYLYYYIGSNELTLTVDYEKGVTGINYYMWDWD